MGVRESLLNTITSVADSDFVRIVTSAGASSKATVANLAKAIIENYEGTSLGGSAQSIKSAVDLLNSKRTKNFCNWARSGSFDLAVGVPAIILTHGGSSNMYGSMLFAIRLNSELQIAGTVPSGMTITDNNGTITVSVPASTFRGFYFLP